MLPRAVQSSSPAAPAGDAVQAWLNEMVSLPAGYRTTRRDALKFVSLGAAGASGWVALTRAKVSYSNRSAAGLWGWVQKVLAKSVESETL